MTRTATRPRDLAILAAGAIAFLIVMAIGGLTHHHRGVHAHEVCHQHGATAPHCHLD